MSQRKVRTPEGKVGISATAKVTVNRQATVNGPTYVMVSANFPFTHSGRECRADTKVLIRQSELSEYLRRGFYTVKSVG